MEYTKTTKDIITDANGNEVDFDAILNKINYQNMQISGMQATLATEQAALDNLKSTVAAIYVLYPDDVPKEVVDACNLNS